MAEGEEWMILEAQQLAIELDDANRLEAARAERREASWAGPRTAQWVAGSVARHNTGPEDHHRWWKSTGRPNVSDWGVAEHDQLCSYLEVAGSKDQLDLSDSVTVERIVQKHQIIEFQYAEKVRDCERGGSAVTSSSASGSAVITNDEIGMFEGWEQVNPTVCCAPALIEHVSKELEKEAQIQEHSRNVREEKALLRPPPGEGPGGDGGGTKR